MTMPGDEPRTGEPVRDPRAWRARPVGEGADWEWGWTSRRRFPWLGIFLVLLGVGLFIRQLRPEITFGSLLLLALGLAFSAAWVVGRSRAAALPTLILVALAGVRILSELRLLTGEGWTPLFLGGALLLAWGAARLQGGGRGWALWIGLLLVLVGLAQVSDRLPVVPDLGPLWPLLIVLAGVLLILGRTLPDLRRGDRARG